MLIALGICMPACEDDVELPVMSENEYPRIFADFPARLDDGSPGVLNATTEQPFVLRVEYTPSDFCEAVWYLDGIEYCRGKVFEYQGYMPIRHHLKLVVSTAKNSTYREVILNVE